MLSRSGVNAYRTEHETTLAGGSRGVSLPLFTATAREDWLQYSIEGLAVCDFLDSVTQRYALQGDVLSELKTPICTEDAYLQFVLYPPNP